MLTQGTFSVFCDFSEIDTKYLEAYTKMIKTPYTIDTG